jgi:hypothetical protein
MDIHQHRSALAVAAAAGLTVDNLGLEFIGLVHHVNAL